MGFVSPTALALLALAIPILLLYLLRLRREERTVSSIYLWQRSVRDIEANAPWQRLRRNLLLILQLAALAALVLATAGPYFPTRRVQGTDLILVMDISASMAATDVHPNRMEAARQEALRLAAGLPAGGHITLIAAGETPRVLLAHSTDRTLFRAALSRLRPSLAHSDLTPALRLAAALAAGSSRSEVALLSDGQVTLSEEVVLPSTFRFLPLGESDQNQGIVACSLEEVAGRLDLFLRLRNYTASPTRRRLDLYADGTLVASRHLDLPAREDLSLIMELEGPLSAVEARLSGQDDLPSDDAAWAVPGRGQKTSIALVSEGNRFLQTGLGLLPGAELTTVVPARFAEWWMTAQAAGPPPDLFLFDRFVPPEIPPLSAFFIAPPSSTVLFQVEGVLESPQPRPAREDDPLLRHVDVAGLGVRRAQAISLPPWARAVLVDRVSGGRPLLLAGEVAGRRVAVLAFDLHASDLPLRVAFPILLSNLVDFLAPGNPGMVPTALSPGEPLVIEAPPQVEEVIVRGPDAKETRLRPEGGHSVFEQTDQAGIYEIVWRGQGREWGRALSAVSLLSSEEGEIAPRTDLPQVRTAGPGAAGPAGAGRLPLWRWLGSAALLLLLVEWGVAYRGGVLALLSGLGPARSGRAKKPG